LQSGEDVDSFCLRDVEFKILVRNANADIKEAVENASGDRGEVWAGDINSESSVNLENFNVSGDWLRVP
jgi:hypothetical protein